MEKRIRICADDYGIAPGVSQAIRALIEARRINATSVMTLFPGLKEEAGRLSAAAQGSGASLGLHLTLTGGFAPLAAAPLGGSVLPSMGGLMAGAFSGRLRRAAVAAEVEAQFAAFMEAFGHAPDHVDGHQHAHLLPGIRAILLEVTHRHAPAAWVRDCVPAPGARLGFDPKGRLIAALSAGLKKAAAARGLSVNKGFAGAYAFRPGVAFEPLLTRFVAGLPDKGLMMVHPGFVDEVLATRDSLVALREAEYEVLAGPAFPEILKNAGARLM